MSASPFCTQVENFLFPCLLCHAMVCCAAEPRGMDLPPKQRTHMRFRIEPKLRERLEKASKQSGRTLTAEVAERLKQSFASEDQQAVLTQIRDELMRANDQILGTLKAVRSDLDDLKRQELEPPRRHTVLPSVIASPLKPKPDEGEDK